MASPDITSAVMAAPASSATGMISFHDSPAKKITNSPEASTKMAVPRSGCLTMSPTGMASSASATTKSSTRRWPSRRWNHHASISGMAIFSTSLG